MNEVNAICADVSENQKGRVYGYARVSTKEQNLARQIEALTSWGVDAKNIYQDKASGKDFERPEYIKLSKKLKHGDVLVIKSIDRLGRCYDDIIAEWRRISHAKGVAIVVIDMPLLDTRECANMQAGLTGRFISDIVLQLQFIKLRHFVLRMLKTEWQNLLAKFQDICIRVRLIQQELFLKIRWLHLRAEQSVSLLEVEWER